MITITVSSNVLHGSDKNTVPQIFKLGTALMGAGFSGACAMLCSAPCLLRDGASFIPVAKLTAMVLGFITAGMSAQIPVTEQNINWQLSNDRILSMNNTSKGKHQALCKFISRRGASTAIITGAVTGLLATAFCYAGYSIEDLKSLVAR